MLTKLLYYLYVGMSTCKITLNSCLGSTNTDAAFYIFPHISNFLLSTSVLDNLSFLRVNLLIEEKEIT